METVGAYEAKTHLPRLLERAEAGYRTTITRHGVPVAVLVPYDQAANVDVQSVIQALRAFREGKRLDGLTVREMVEEGRR